MGNKKIKHLGKKKRKKNKRKVRTLIIAILVIISTITIFEMYKYIDDMYSAKNIENNKVEFYMDIADQCGEYKVQVSWKELMAIDMVRHDDDLSSIKKNDTLKIGKLFVERDKGKDGSGIYTLKSFNQILDDIEFDNSQKKKANENLDKLKNTSINKSVAEDDEKILFIDKVKKVAVNNYKQYGILPSITVGQAILESGWGQSELSLKSMNIFGIKADSRWKGETIELVTSENYDDKVVASFRAYNSIDASIKDHGKFLYENQRYRENGLFESAHYTTQAQSLEDAGYSTKTNEDGEKIYAETLIHVIRGYNLQLIDHEVESK